jgi:hypothetical protein
MPDLTPGDSLRAIADHLDAHPNHGVVTVFIHNGCLDDPADMDIVLDGATVADIDISDPESAFPGIRRDFGLATLSTTVPRRLISERRPTVVEQVMSTTELLAARNQQQLEVQA